MTKTSDKYARVFGAKKTEHADVRFVSPDGHNVVLTWQKNEYRAFQEDRFGKLTDMRLGGTSAENLKNYIMQERR